MAEGYSRLVIPNIQPNQNGKLRVEAENAQGTTESEGQIRVSDGTGINGGIAGGGAPQIRQQLQSVTVKEGESVEFSTTITGEPTPTVRWLLNDKVVSY